MSKILLVDDDETARGVIEALLRYESHEVHLAANGKQALFMVKDKAPDIVLSDIRMPGMSGIEFCRELRKDPSTKHTYVILATGFDTPESKTEGIASGADDYIGKPIRADELYARVRIGARIRALGREAEELKRRLAEAEKARTEGERLASRLSSLRGDLTLTLGTLLDEARRAADTCRQGDLKFACAALEKMTSEVEALRNRIAPREGS